MSLAAGFSLAGSMGCYAKNVGLEGVVKAHCRMEYIPARSVVQVLSSSVVNTQRRCRSGTRSHVRSRVEPVCHFSSARQWERPTGLPACRPGSISLAAQGGPSLERLEDALPAGKWKHAAAFVEMTSCVGADQNFFWEARVRRVMICGGGSSPTELEEMGSKVWGKKRVGYQVFVFDGEIEL